MWCPSEGGRGGAVVDDASFPASLDQWNPTGRALNNRAPATRAAGIGVSGGRRAGRPGGCRLLRSEGVIQDPRGADLHQRVLTPAQLSDPTTL